METLMACPARLAECCAQTDAGSSVHALTGELRDLMPGLDLEWVLTRGRWHRLGGVVDADLRPVSNSITHWAEQESDGDVAQLIARHGDSGYFATRLTGKTHYFTLSRGDNAEDFIQLEIEELQEVVDRRLIVRGWYPDSLEELLDPLDYPRLDPKPVGKPYYLFRRIMPIAKLLGEEPRANQALSNVRRFFQDWRQSSACEGEPFCRHWVLALREYMDSDGEYRLSAKPVSTFCGELPALPSGESLWGTELANAIHGYDHLLGYHFAWYFIMLSRKAANFTLAEAVLRDQMGAYDYLPARDLNVLRQWEERPYGV
jgi:hypothetical protein